MEPREWWLVVKGERVNRGHRQLWVSVFVHLFSRPFFQQVNDSFFERYCTHTWNSKWGVVRTEVSTSQLTGHTCKAKVLEWIPELLTKKGLCKHGYLRVSPLSLLLSATPNISMEKVLPNSNQPSSNMQTHAHILPIQAVLELYFFWLCPWK